MAEQEVLDLCGVKFVSPPEEEEGDEAIPFRTLRKLDIDGVAQNSYQFGIHVIEVRNLVGKQRNGMSDPVVEISIINDSMKETRSTSVARNCLNAIFDEQFFFELELSEEEFNTTRIEIAVYDSNMLWTDALIGKLSIDPDVIRNWNEMTVPPTWYCLSNADVCGSSQGFIRCASFVLKPGEEKSKAFNELETIVMKDFKGSLSSQLVLPPQIHPEQVYLVVHCLEARGLPKMDTFGTCDGLVKASFGGASLSTEPVDNTYNPSWNTTLKIPCLLPTLSDDVFIDVYDRDNMLVKQINEQISSLHFSFNDIQMSEGIAPRWYHLYRSSGVGLFDWIAGERATYSHQSSTNWAGMVLLGFETMPFLPTASLPEFKAVTEHVSGIAKPELSKWELHWHVSNATGFPIQYDKIRLVLEWGPEKRETRATSGTNGSFYLGTDPVYDAVETIMPDDITQLPDAIISVYVGDNRFGFIRVSDFSNEYVPQWREILPDPTSSLSHEFTDPPMLLCALKAYNECKRPEYYSAPDMPADRSVYVHGGIVYAEKLLPMDEHGNSNTSVSVALGGGRFETEIIDDLAPSFNQSFSFVTSVPVDDELVPAVQIKLNQHDRKNISIGGYADFMYADIAQTPGYRWAQLVQGVNKKPCGRVLLYLEVSDSEKMNFKMPPIEVRPLHFEFALAAIQDLVKPYKQVSFDCSMPHFDSDGYLSLSKTEYNSNTLTVSSANAAVISDAMVDTVHLPVDASLCADMLVRVYYTKSSKKVFCGFAHIDINSRCPEVVEANRTEVELDEEGEADGMRRDPFFLFTEDDTNVRVGETVELKGEIGDEPLVQGSCLPQHFKDFPPVDNPDDPLSRVKLPSEIEDFLNENPYDFVDFWNDSSNRKGFWQKFKDIFKEMPKTSQGMIKFNLQLSTTSLTDVDTLLSQISCDFCKRKLVTRIYLTKTDLNYDDVSNTEFYVTLSLGSNLFEKQFLYKSDPVQEIKELVVDIPVNLPDSPIVCIAIWKIGLIHDKLVGGTLIDTEQRWLSKEWCDIDRKPLQRRTLWSPLSLFQQGTIDLWFEIFEAGTEPLPLDLTPPKPILTEVRVVVWNTRNVVFKEKDHSDIIISADLMGQDHVSRQNSDTNWRSLDGKGFFNWRYVFNNVPVPTKHCRLRLQLWDRDMLSRNESIAEAVVDLQQILRKYRHQRSRLGVSRQWITLLHPNTGLEPQGEVEIEMCIMDQDEAIMNPVGLGRQAPNDDPYLPEPDRPPTSYAPWRIDKKIGEIYQKIKRILYCTFITIIVLMLYILFW
ncbi:hypothetical protein PCE1_004907 [Barthelona sp. PCE]